MSNGTEKVFSGTATKDSIRDLLAGMAGGFICRIIEYPLDTIKVLQQIHGSAYLGPMDCLRRTFRQGGPLAFFKGLSIPLAGSTIECAALFFTYGRAKELLGVNENAGTGSFWRLLVCGGLSGISTAFVVTPIELIKCRLQAQVGGAIAKQGQNGPLQCARDIFRSSGVRGFWKGYFSCLMREVPGNMAWFGAYEMAQSVWMMATGVEKQSELSLFYSALSGSCAGIGYWMVPYPADTIKSRIQTDPNMTGKSFMQVARHVVDTEGLIGLYRGCTITCLRAVPSCAMVYYVYDWCDRWLITL